MSKRTLAGASALLIAPVLAAVAAVLQPTLSDEAAAQVAALSDHRAAMITANAVNTIALALLIAGTVWLALTLAPLARRLALAAGILGVLGSLVLVFQSGVAAASPSVVGGLDPAQATGVLDRIHTAVSGLEPLSLLLALGLTGLALAAVRAGASRLGAAAIAIGAFGQSVGFAAGTKTVVVAAFAVLLVGLAQVVYTLAVREQRPLAEELVSAT